MRVSHRSTWKTLIPPLSRSTGQGRRGAGFTLLELIVASAIMSLLALTLYTALSIAFKARDRALASVGPARAGEIAIDLVRRDLESALPSRGGLLVLGFNGTEGYEIPGTTAVEFFAMAGPKPESFTQVGQSITAGPRATQRLDPMSFGGIQRVQLLLRPAVPGGGFDPASGAVLVRRVTRNLLAEIEDMPEEQVICRGVTAFSVRYFDGLNWTDEWDSTLYGNSMPMAVEVAIEVTGPRDTTAEQSPNNTMKYNTSRSFFLPCRDEAALASLGGIR